MALYEGQLIRNASVTLMRPDLAAMRNALETAEIAAPEKTWCERARSDDAILFFAIAESDRPVGQIMLHDMEGVVVSLVGYHVFRAADRRRGIGTLALQALCRYAFDEMKIARLIAITSIDNYASQALATTCGFTNKGAAREGAHKVVFERLR